MTREEMEQKMKDFMDSMVNYDPKFNDIVNKYYFDLIDTSLPPAEGAEEILASLVESLGEPDNSVTDHSYQIRPLTVEGKREWWMFHNGVGSGEPLAQWLSKFAILHAQKIADKMVEEKEELIIGDYLEWFYTQTIPTNHSIATIKTYLKTREK